jgi:hypothetical protein
MGGWNLLTRIAQESGMPPVGDHSPVIKRQSLKDQLRRLKDAAYDPASKGN